MKFKIGQKVTALNKKCLIVGTKESPHKQDTDQYFRKEIYPEKDYLVFIFKEMKEKNEVYLGMMDLSESEIDNKGW